MLPLALFDPARATEPLAQPRFQCSASAISAAKSAVFVVSGEQIAMRSILRTTVGMIVSIAHVLGAEAFSGRDAVYIDWGVKNCEAVSTDKEHALIEQANANSRSNFIEQYSNESNKIAGSLARIMHRM
jgi:hypothetical protein